MNTLANIRAEFLEMPGLSLTLAQAARVFALDLRHTKHLLTTLGDEGFLVRDERGAYRRRDMSSKCEDRIETLTSPPSADARDEAFLRSKRSSTPAPADMLEAVGVELPCLGCDRSYRISLRKIRLSQSLMGAGCTARHFADCPPAAFAHLIDPVVLAEFEEAVERIELAAEGAGGRLVGPT